MYMYIYIYTVYTEYTVYTVYTVHTVFTVYIYMYIHIHPPKQIKLSVFPGWLLDDIYLWFRLFDRTFWGLLVAIY